MLVVTGTYSMNAFDLVFWAAAWALLTAMGVGAVAPGCSSLDAPVLGFGLMNKVGLSVSARPWPSPSRSRHWRRMPALGPPTWRAPSALVIRGPPPRSDGRFARLCRRASSSPTA